MNLLLDTHIVLWWLSDPDRITARIQDAIKNAKNRIWISAVVGWEIRIKEALGKLTIPVEYDQVLWDQGFIELPITFSQVNVLTTLAAIHRDPFDRLLVAQALAENFTLVSADSILENYGVPILLNG